MRFVDVIVGVVLIGVVSLILCNGMWMCKNLDIRYRKISKTLMAEKFIAESFKKTCKGTGFTDLNEWQITCREMFGLEYIGWSNANEFMDVSMKNSDDELFYGIWKYENKINEVYSRRKH